MSNPVAEQQQAEGSGSSSVSSPPSPYSKPCTLCQKPRDVLVRCQIDDTLKWHFVCPGKCWQQVSGGRIDGDKQHPMYRYGGMWKNKHEAVSAKRKKNKKKIKDAPATEAGDAINSADLPDPASDEHLAPHDTTDDGTASDESEEVRPHGSYV